MFRVPGCVLLLTALMPSIIAAQTPRTLSVGERVRVAQRCRIVRDRVTECYDAGPSAFVVGELQAVDADSIHLRPAASEATLAIPRAFVTQVWVGEGTRSNFWAGAGSGLLVGALLGGMVGSQMEWCMLWSCSPATGLGIGVGASAGFLLGGIVGSATHSDRWRAVSPEGLHLTVEPAADGLRVAASVSF